MLRILRTGAGGCLQLRARELFTIFFSRNRAKDVCVCVCVIQQSRAQEHKSKCAKAEDDVG